MKSDEKIELTKVELRKVLAWMFGETGSVSRSVWCSATQMSDVFQQTLAEVRKPRRAGTNKGWDTR